jgi:hypothetical protein
VDQAIAGLLAVEVVHRLGGVVGNVLVIFVGGSNSTTRPDATNASSTEVSM